MGKKNDISIREKIVESATEMFVTEGCKQIKMDTIAERMGISKRTIYENFSDKEELLSLCVEKVICSLKSFEKSILDSENPANFINWVYGFSALHHNMMFDAGPRFVEDIHQYYPAIFEKYFANHEEERLSSLRKIVEFSARNGYLREGTDPDMVVCFVNEMVKQIYFNKLTLSPQYSKKQIFIHFFKSYFRGISSEKFIADIERKKMELKELFYKQMKK